jgi:hypothetical protein
VITEHEMELVRRVAISTIPPYRASVLALFQNPTNLTPNGGLTVTACVKANMSKTTTQDRLTELVELTILTKDASAKEHQYRPLPEFVDIVSRPLEPLDHLIDLTLQTSPGELPGGVHQNSKVRDSSHDKSYENQADLI